jgi:hypothetical protein
LKAPRVRLAWVMVAVAIAALDFLAIRAYLDSYGPWAWLMLLGAMPMANVLAVGLLIARQRPKSRAFLLGFQTVGAAALALHVILMILVIEPMGASTPCNQLLEWYLDLVCRPIVASIGNDQSLVLAAVQFSVVVVLLGWPQLAFALIGGFLSRRYQVTITRR